MKAWRPRSAARFCATTAANNDRADRAMDAAHFFQLQLLIWDRSLYDPEKGEYTVGRFLAETESRIGPDRRRFKSGMCIQTWVSTTAINFDMLRDLPGGIAGVRGMVEQFHRPRSEGIFSAACLDTELETKAWLQPRLWRNSSRTSSDGIKLRYPGGAFRQASRGLGRDPPSAGA